MTDKLKRDRSGEPFEDTFTEDRGVHPAQIEEAAHDLNLEGDQITGGDAAASIGRSDRPEKKDERS